MKPIDISQVMITETEGTLKDELTVVQDKSCKEIQEFNRTSPHATILSPGHGYNDYEINETGKDRTTDFLTSGPGQGTIGSAISSFIKHPWGVRIFAGLLFVIVITYMGLK